MQSLLLIAVVTSLNSPAPDPVARALIDTAIARMGGMETLRSVVRLKVESMTEWHFTVLDPRAYVPVQSYERSTELRDYQRRSWRYTRRFLGALGTTDLINVVTDSGAAIQLQGRWRPQNSAYLDERNEWFMLSPERLMPLVANAPDARAIGDTTIRATRYARVGATVQGYRLMVHIGKRDGVLGMVTFRHGQTKDFGLAPWGDMDVAVIYSRWRRLVSNTDLIMPTQFDIFRVGVPYKRVTVLGIELNPEIPADSFAISDSMLAAHRALGGRAMWDLPIDSATVTDGRYAVFFPGLAPAGAIKVGGRWLMIEGGVAPPNFARSVAALRKADVSAQLAGVLHTAQAGSGGLASAADQQLTIWSTTSGRPYAVASLRGWGRAASLTSLAPERWLRIGTDSLQVVTIDAPDFPSASVVYVPSLRWAYTHATGALSRASAIARERGWTVDRIGTSQNFVGEAPR